MSGAAEVYFLRNQGEWHWTVDFKIISWRKLWFSPTSFSHKVRYTDFLLSQKFLGLYRMRTEVNFSTGDKQVFHQTRLLKWGFCFYKSEKIFTIEADGSSLSLEGVEHYWPFLTKPSPFQGLKGRIDLDTLGAYYQMPLMGLRFDCQTFLAADEGRIEMATDSMTAKMELRPESLSQLKTRAQN